MHSINVFKNIQFHIYMKTIKQDLIFVLKKNFWQIISSKSFNFYLNILSLSLICNLENIRVYYLKWDILYTNISLHPLSLSLFLSSRPPPYTAGNASQRRPRRVASPRVVTRVLPSTPREVAAIVRRSVGQLDSS